MTSRLAASLDQPGAQPQDLKTLSLEELLQIDVTAVSRESERRLDAPAAVSVITGEDIRRYGVDTLADALRLADSVSVARFNGGSWAIATRGFSAITNNKLLVMIDGRSICQSAPGRRARPAHQRPHAEARQRVDRATPEK
jgi:iron complex outermembrane receptor protein